MIACSSNGPLHIVVPKGLVEVMEDLNGEDLVGVRGNSIWETPVSPKWDANPISAKHSLCVAGVGCNVEWVEVRGKGFE